ncbi:MAG: hypothetical protein K0S16_1748 [Moraxellaceae bacterium]|jgi:hypothetical protein|nr:hypothetical protein [Moraxellaceae bacterium]
MQFRKGAAVLLLTGCGSAGAETVMIAHQGMLVDSLPRARVAHLFMGRETALPDGTPVTPLIVAGTALENFAQDVLGKSSDEVRQHWARLTFKGLGVPPRMVSAAEANARVARTPGAIAVIDRRDVGPHVKIIRVYSRKVSAPDRGIGDRRRGAAAPSGVAG